MENKLTRADKILIGFLLIIGLSEVANLVAIVLHKPFSAGIRLFIAACVILMIAVIFLPAKETHRIALTGQGKIVHLAFIALFLLQLLYILQGKNVYDGGDLTVETVNTMLTTDTIYQINPLTGQAFAQGMPMRLKIISLPMLYAFLCRVIPLESYFIIQQLVPAIVLALAYFAYSALAEALFAEDTWKQSVFLLCVAILISFGDYMYGMEGFGVLHAGYRGATIRMAVIVPYLFSLLIRRNRIGIVLCILAEACIVWTFYGMGACVLITFFYVACGRIWRKLSERRKGHG
ncbi:MAG: hypothetical protein K6G30_14565 [Acetatifactor sp.]|nr:hypothetical protein [Acetatifactor sp.]